jgi:hypothetical protein
MTWSVEGVLLESSRDDDETVLVADVSDLTDMADTTEGFFREGMVVELRHISFAEPGPPIAGAVAWSAGASHRGGDPVTATVTRLRLLPPREEQVAERVIATWPDGSQTRAAGYATLLRQVRDLQWEPMSRKAFRAAMAHRAEVWSGTKISTRGSSRRFARELARAGIFEIKSPWG